MTCQATYPDGGCPPTISTYTVQPSNDLPNTGASSNETTLIGGGLVLAGILLTVLVARCPVPKWLRWHSRGTWNDGPK